MRCSFVILLVLLAASLLLAQTPEKSSPSQQDTVVRQRADSAAQESVSTNPWTERRIISVILSTVIPGSGQTYLGHAEKGALFTIGTLGCGLIAGLSENNVVGRNERIDELKAQYELATSYIGADSIWTKLVSTKSILDKDARRRDLFVKLTAAFWIANLVDIIFFSNDRGERSFGLLETRRTTFALVPHPRNGLNAALTVRW